MEELAKYDLTNQQKALYNIDLTYKNSKINNIISWMKIDVNIDFVALKKAINSVLMRNDNYRIKIINENEKISQVIEKYAEKDFNIIEVNGIPELEEYLKKIDVSVEKGNLCECVPFRCKNDKSGFAVVAHHTIADAWSMSLFIKEALSVYFALINNMEYDLSAFPSYLEYVETQKEYMNSEKYLKDKEYWEEKYKNKNDFLIFRDLDNFKDIESKRKEFNIDGKLLNSIREFCGKNKISEYVFFLSVFCIYFSRIKGLDRYIIGNPILNRSNFKEKCMGGLFISTMPFFVEVDHKKTFIDFAKGIATEQMSMYKHIKYPEIEIAKYINEINQRRGTIYDVVFSYQNAKVEKDEKEFDAETRWVEAGEQVDSLMIHFKDTDATGNPLLIYDYLTSVFSNEDINIMNERIEYICKQVLNDIKLSEIEIVSENEMKYLLVTCNNTMTEYDKAKTIVDNIEKIALEKENEIALICNDEKITYDALNKKANKIARIIKKYGVKKGEIVPVIDSRSIDMIVGMLAVLKLGCAYLPIDIEYPKDRIEYIVNDVNAKVVLTRKVYEEKLGNESKKVFLDSDEFLKEKDKNINEKIPSDSLAYLIYTSGTTGKPKGVMITHRNVINFINGTSNIIDFNNKTMVSVTTISFDIFVLESWLSLSNGMTIVIANENEQNIAENLNKLCMNNNVQMIQTTPSRLKLLINDEKNNQFIKNMTDIMVGGEAVPYDLIEKLRILTHANIYDMYGPTETTVWSTIKDLTKDEKVTIGKPIANTQVYILDAQKKICPINVSGNLYIGGDGVGKGYYKKEELTAEKFINNPYKVNDAIYETGDIALWDKSGNLVCLGRNDFQIKLNGHRIEIEEIENVLLKYEGVVETAVIVKENTLVAYYVSSQEIDSNMLRQYLSNTLPMYMIPSVYIQIEALPKTPNGKISRKELISKTNLHESVLETKRSIKEPSNEVERILVEAFEKVIEKKLSVDEPYFNYSLDSLLVIKIQILLLKNQWDITLQDFYRYHTIEELAKEIVCRREEREKEFINEVSKNIVKENIEDIVLSGKKNEYKNILLTGATGFIGIHLLEELLLKTNANIYCIVRPKNNLSGKERIVESIQFYFNGKYVEEIEKRITIIEKDITNTIDLEENEKIDCVIHSAALVKHYGNVELFKKVNISGTQNIIDLCKKYHCPLYYLSSISVSGNYLVKQDNKDKEFTEDDLNIGQRYQDNVYVYSKYECEKMIHAEMNNGLSATIFRIGIVSGRYRDGLMQNNISENAFYNRIKAITKIGAISEAISEQTIEFTPVDLVANAIVGLVNIPESLNKVFHIYNDEAFNVSDILKALKMLEIDISVLRVQQFNDLIEKISSDLNETKKLEGIVNDFYNTQNGMELNYDYTISIKCEKTKKYLKLLNFQWPCSKLDKEKYLNEIFKYMRKVKYL